MRLFTFTLFLTMLAITLSGQNSTPPFSDLSLQRLRSADLTSVVTDQGIIYSYRPRDGSSIAPWPRRFYFMDFEGQVVDSTEFSDRAILGDLLESEGRYFFAGLEWRPSPEPPLKILIEFSNRMAVINYQGWESILPDEFGGVIPFSNTESGDGVNLSKLANYGLHSVSADTLFSASHFLLADPELSPFPYGAALHIDRVGIAHDQAAILPSIPVGSFSSACITDKYIYVFGEVGGTILDNGVILNAGPAFRQSKQGTDEASLDFGNTHYGYFGGGILAQYHEGKIYCNYSNQRLPISESFCDDSNDYSAIIDMRDEEFNLIKRIDVPLCRAVTTGRAPFAFGSDGSIYHTTSTNELEYFLLKFDAGLNELWKVQLPGLGNLGMPMSSSILPDGSIIVECVKEMNSAQWFILLYKVSPDGLITSTTTLGNAASAPTFHPNPFTNELSLLAPPERPLRVDVFGMDGRAHGSYRAQDGRLQLGHLPGGAYVLRMSDAESGAFVGAQQVVKVGSR